MRSPLQTFRDWRKARDFAKAQQILTRALKDENSEYAKLVNQHAMNMAGRMIMNWLDHKSIRHCHFCPSTEQLKKLGKDAYACGPHFDQVQANESKAKDEAIKKVPRGPLKPEDIGLTVAKS